MATKICNICNKNKSLDDFAIHKKSRDFRSTICKRCHNFRYYLNHRPLTEDEQYLAMVDDLSDLQLDQKRFYHKINSMHIITIDSNHFVCTQCGEYCNISEMAQKQSYHCLVCHRFNRRCNHYADRTKANKYASNKRRTDVNFKLRTNLRGRLTNYIKQLKNSGLEKTGSAISDLGCTIEELKSHLESNFLPGMSWENYGNKVDQWSLDHIIPLSSFDLSKRKQWLKACHYTNLQPLWHIDNMRKGNRY